MLVTTEPLITNPARFVTYEVPVTVHVLVESSVGSTVLPELALLMAPESEDPVVSDIDRVLMSSTMTFPVNAVSLAANVTKPPFSPAVPHVPLFSASAVNSVLAPLVTVTSLNVMTAVVLAMENNVAGLFVPLEVSPSEQNVAVHVNESVPSVIVKLPVPELASPDVLLYGKMPRLLPSALARFVLDSVAELEPSTTAASAFLAVKLAPVALIAPVE
jgi:hypothetical protein